MVPKKCSNGIEHIEGWESVGIGRMRDVPGTPGWNAWMKVVADIRAQNKDKTPAEIDVIIKMVRREFSPKWDTYVYVK